MPDQKTHTSPARRKLSKLAISCVFLVPLAWWMMDMLPPQPALVALPIASFLLMAIAMDRIRRPGSSTYGTLLVLLSAVLAVLVVAPHHYCESARRSACVNNLKQLGLVFNMYASEHDGRFPPIDDTRNNFIFEGDAIYPEYLTDANIAACPHDPDSDSRTNFRLSSTLNHPGFPAGVVHPDCITDMSYTYLGWIITSDEEAEAFFDAYDKLAPGDHDGDIVVPQGKGNGGGNIIHRLGPGAERFLNYPSRDSSTIPIMWDKSSADIVNWSHIPVGGNVLYLDGHVEFIRYPGKFPMTEKFGRLLDERPREPIPDCDE